MSNGVPIRQFVQCIQQLNGYLNQLSCLYKSNQATKMTKWVEPFGDFDSCDNLSRLCTTLMTHGDDILTTLKTIEKILWRPPMQLVTTFWLPWMTLLMTHVTTYGERLMVGSILGNGKENKVMTTTAHNPKWQCGKSHKTSHVTTTATPDKLSEDQNMTLTTLMTTGDYLGWSMLQPIDNPKKFL